MEAKKAVVTVAIQVMVEVERSDSYVEMVESAKEELRKRIVAGKGFKPFLCKAGTVYTGTTLDKLQDRIVIHPMLDW